MNEYLKKLWEKIKEIYSGLEVRQKIILASLFVFTIVTFVWLISWSSRVEYSLLFGDMNSKDADIAIEKLKELSIKYELRDAGKSIFIPSNAVYETRISLSSEGIGNSSGIGYEIFDKSSLGMTEFVLKKNFLRAIQGELSRTIEAIEGVENARIHLVMPEKAIFQEDQKEPSASVMLRTSNSLRKKQIDGIVNLIASAVEGLTRNSIVITNQSGDLLTENISDGVTGASNFQARIKKQLEHNLWSKTQSMLDEILGPNNSVVRVHTELNFDQIETTLEKYNPESKVSRSEEIETTSDVNEADSLDKSRESIISNYEIDKTLQHIKKQVGNIKRLTISVSINHKQTTKEVDGKFTTETISRTDDELDSIKQLVSNSVGYNSERGDEIVVISTHFEDTFVTAKLRQEQLKDKKDLIDLIIKGIVVLVLVGLVYALTRQFRQIFATKEPDDLEDEIRPVLAEGTEETEGFYPEGEEGMPMGDGKITYSFKPMKDIEIEQTESLILMEKIKKFIVENPEVAMQLLNSWMIEDRKG